MADFVIDHVADKWCHDLHCRKCYSADAWQKAEVVGLRDDVLRLHADKMRLYDLLLRLKYWDHLETAADGPYWRAEIDKAISPTTVGTSEG